MGFGGPTWCAVLVAKQNRAECLQSTALVTLGLAHLVPGMTVCDLHPIWDCIQRLAFCRLTRLWCIFGVKLLLYYYQGRSGQVRKISPPTGIRSPDRPARSQSLYRLSYRAHLFFDIEQFYSPLLHILWAFVSVKFVAGEVRGALSAGKIRDDISLNNSWLR